MAFPLQCYAWFVGSLIRILCVGYCVAEVVLSVPVLLGQFAPAFTAGLRRCRRGCGHVLLPIIEL